MSRILICGRGESLINYKKLIDRKFDYVYLINAFNKFIIDDPDLCLFLQKKVQEGAEIIQIVNIELPGLDKNLIETLKIKEVQCTRLKATKEKVWWREYFDSNRFKKSLGIKIECQPECLEPYMGMLENSIGVPILNSILEKNAKKITIIGSDFYEADYFLSYKSADWAICSLKTTQDRLKAGMNRLIEAFPHIAFEIITHSTYSNNFKNCKINQ